MLEMTVNVVGPLRENCYFVYDEAGDLVIVDPGDWAKRLIDQIEERGLRPRAILLTHGHFDHIGAVSELADTYSDIPVYAASGERVILEDAAANGSRVFGPGELRLDRVCYLSDRDRLDLLGTDWEIIVTPGHSAGSSCYYIADEGVLFSGDTLFAGDCGRTDLRTGSTEDILHSIREVLMKLPDETLVYPGHGPATSIGSERVHNIVMRM